MNSLSLLRSLAQDRTTCVTFYLPTHKHGNETLSDSSRFRTLLNIAARNLADGSASPDQIRQILEPVESLVSPPEFWQNRSEGLAVFASEQSCRHLSLPYSVTEGVHVSPYFHLRQTIPYLSDETRFFVLALSKNSIRLFQGDRHSLVPVELLDGPKSMEEALRYEDPERQLQMRSVGGGNLSFHGHGAGEELDKESLERFFRAVDKSVVAALHLESAPLVLASVPYYLPIYAAVTNYSHLFGEAIEGNPDHLAEKDLQRSATQLLATYFDAEHKRRTGRIENFVGTGLVIEDIDEVVDAAVNGRIQTLLVALGPPSDNSVSEYKTNQAISETILHSGSVEMSPVSTHSEGCVQAMLRY